MGADYPVVARQFDEMEDEYLRERGGFGTDHGKGLRAMKGVASPIMQPMGRLQ
jgi:hypothetical protein